LSAAERESRRTIQEQKVRGGRVLAVQVNPDAVMEWTGDVVLEEGAE